MIALGTSAAGHSRAVTVGQPEICAAEKNELQGASDSFRALDKLIPGAGGGNMCGL